MLIGSFHLLGNAYRLDNLALFKIRVRLTINSITFERVGIFENGFYHFKVDNIEYGNLI